jgi:hemerythrin
MDRTREKVALACSCSPPAASYAFGTVSFATVATQTSSKGHEKMSEPGSGSAESGAVFITWREEYSVGHEELDGHHKVIFSILNELFQVMQGGSYDRMAGQGLLDRLVEYTKLHFDREEELLESHGYADLASHRKAHRRLVSDLDLLQVQNSHAETFVKADLLAFLKRWWLQHICKVDKQYAPVLAGLQCSSDRAG